MSSKNKVYKTADEYVNSNRNCSCIDECLKRAFGAGAESKQEEVSTLQSRVKSLESLMDEQLLNGHEAIRLSAKVLDQEQTIYRMESRHEEAVYDLLDKITDDQNFFNSKLELANNAIENLQRMVQYYVDRVIDQNKEIEKKEGANKCLKN